ncbi:class I SAM-dependent methyltransferase [Streptomyces sp. MUM 203J]|uniref:class I SAM-dependent methyltransferase n=1 Tax=Streptomyces sp. MUM 203J TaxID=2791990 RepID=UPI001F0407B5|nr:class I SAM-dependent methyltransferase [Streptomyces sp. MUM 203J]MCH0540798.1 class I SAM-dependent methyltransferase [Streptomyces sp. MUM 203J]
MNASWSGGDYTAAGDAWANAADDVAAHALGGLAAEGAPRVLDVGTGSGPAALAAARAGARVTALDLESGLLRTARARARRAGLDHRTRFVVGDARALPFPDGSFDLALSTFGVMFAPDPPRTAAELARVCRPGGLLAVASWTPDGVLGRVAPVVTRHLDRPPAAPPPTRWGEPDRLRAWFAPLPVSLHSRVVHVRVTYPSVAHAVAVFEDKPGPLRVHRAALEAAGRWQAARADLAALFTAHNTAADGTLAMDVPYLLGTGRVHG